MDKDQKINKMINVANRILSRINDITTTQINKAGDLDNFDKAVIIRAVIKRLSSYEAYLINESLKENEKC